QQDRGLRRLVAGLVGQLERALVALARLRESPGDPVDLGEVVLRRRLRAGVAPARREPGGRARRLAGLVPGACVEERVGERVERADAAFEVAELPGPVVRAGVGVGRLP